MQPTRFYEIDLFRFISAIAVVIYHYTFVGWKLGRTPEFNFEMINAVTKYFYLGINFFFVISGFVVLLSLHHGSAKKFALSRFIRLYPAYWVALITTTTIVVWFSGAQHTITIGSFIANATMFNSGMGILPIDGSYWTLWIELQFYLLMLIITVSGGLKYIEHILMGAAVVSLISLLSPQAANVNMFTSLFPHWGGYFIAGCTFYVITQEGFSAYRGIIVGLSVAFILKQSVDFAALLTQWYGTEFNSTTVIIINLLFLMLFAIIALFKSNPLRRPIWIRLGVLTYPLYLLHQEIGYVIMNRFALQIGKLELVTITTVIAIVMAWFLHYGIEKPVSRWLKRHSALGV
ncbi:acyltransferase family protein [Thaumasiovibrio sp. DFM-14]|uniref:acyltransferase family protein n=1 Tax=Thaumasiovibrio sp. DFM-14 TaxID=3384792 RepID=UPI0039A28C79